MKNIYLSVLIILGLSSNIFSQSFEGSLSYFIKQKSLSEKLKIVSNEADTLVFFYSKNGDYLISSFTNTNIIVYKSKDNLIYTIDPNVTMVVAIDASIDLEEKQGFMPKIVLLDTLVKVNDKDCKVVEVKWKAGIYKYYFSPGLLSVNPEIYKRHKYDQWYQYLLISKSLPLRIEKTIFGLKEEVYELINYSTSEFDKSIFDLPKMKEDKELEKLFPYKKVFIYK